LKKRGPVRTVRRIHISASWGPPAEKGKRVRFIVNWSEKKAEGPGEKKKRRGGCQEGVNVEEGIKKTKEKKTHHKRKLTQTKKVPRITKGARSSVRRGGGGQGEGGWISIKTVEKNRVDSEGGKREAYFSPMRKVNQREKEKGLPFTPCGRRRVSAQGGGD